MHFIHRPLRSLHRHTVSDDATQRPLARRPPEGGRRALMASNWERDYLIRRKCKCLAAISRATRTSRSVRPNISKAITKLVAYPRRRRHGEHGPKSTSKTTAARRLARGAERQRIPLHLGREGDLAAGPPRDDRQMPVPHRQRRPPPRAAGTVARSKIRSPTSLRKRRTHRRRSKIWQTSRASGPERRR